MNEPTPALRESSHGNLRALVQKTAAGRSVLRLRLSDIAPDPEQPRKTFDLKSLAELAASLRINGQLQPVIVRESGTSPPYFLVIGERRWRAAAEAGLEELEALLEDPSTPSAERRIHQLAENLQREDLRLLETARALKDLVDRGIGPKALAESLGKSPAFVSQHLATLKAKGLAKEALEDGLLQSPETFRRFAGLHQGSQSRLLSAARKAGAPIGRNQVERVAPASGRATRTKTKAAATRGRPKLYARRFQPRELRVLLSLFGVEVPEDDRDLGAAFEAALTARLGDQEEGGR